MSFSSYDLKPFKGKLILNGMIRKHYSINKQKIKGYLETIVSTKTSPHSIALGFALGTFINILPTPGLNIILGLLSLLLFKQASKFSLLISMLIWNPLLAPFVYVLSFRIGDLFFASSPNVVVDFNFWQHVYYFSRRFLVGNIILAISLSFSSYFLIKFAMRKYYGRSNR